MIKQSSLLRKSLGNKNAKSGNGQWLHPADALQCGHIVYLVKFLGRTEVEQPKGIEVVKEGIQKLKFTQQIKKSDGSSKIPKVELTISVDGVAIQEPKTKRAHHKYPLHRISYCADDKSDKRLFSFIAKEADSNKHNCFVFVSDKLAEEITLTIGQAFDLAYKKFLETINKDLDMKKRFILLQKRAKELTSENEKLRQKISELEQSKENAEDNVLEDGVPTVGRRLENLLLADLEDLEPNNNSDPVTNGNNVDLFGAKPFLPTEISSEDPFGMGDFSPMQEEDLESAIGAIDKKLVEMRDGFSCGLSFGNDDFSADLLDTSKTSSFG